MNNIFRVLKRAKWWMLFGVAVVLVGALLTLNKATPGAQDALAQCISDSGAKFYGAFWCGHCQAQKRAFGKSERLLPYIECSTPDGQGQQQVCKDAGIESYPTWRFAEGEQLTGEVALKTLAERTKCTYSAP